MPSVHRWRLRQLSAGMPTADAQPSRRDGFGYSGAIAPIGGGGTDPWEMAHPTRFERVTSAFGGLPEDIDLELFYLFFSKLASLDVAGCRQNRLPSVPNLSQERADETGAADAAPAAVSPPRSVEDGEA